MPLNVTLASSLLDLELAQDQRAAQCGGRTWRTGNSSLDTALPADLWRGGTVVGIGIGIGSTGIESGTRSLSSSLAHEIIATHLLDDADAAAQRGTGHTDTESNTGSGTSVSVFIVAPPDQATSSIRRIYQLLNERVSTSIYQVPTQPQPQSSRTRSSQASPPPLTPDATAKHLLAHVSLLQYLDISGLSESLSEVLTVLTSPSATATQTKSILLIQGLPGCVNTTLRRSGMVQSAALLASVVGAIRDVVRGSGETCIGFVEMELGWVNPDPGMRADGNTNTNPSHVAPRGPAAAQRGVGLATAFASQTGRIMRLNLHATLAWVVEEGVDVLVAVHDADGKMSAPHGGDKRIAEVVRDERADHAGEASAVGTWAVWE